MQAKAELYGVLIRQCRMMRMSADVDRARAALDVEQEISVLMRQAGVEVPEPATTRRRRRTAQPVVAVVAAESAGRAA